MGSNGNRVTPLQLHKFRLQKYEQVKSLHVASIPMTFMSS